MADASPPLEREALLKKDKDELSTIVDALGGRAPARATKAKLADLILELAGVTDTGPADEPEPEAAPQPEAAETQKVAGSNRPASAPPKPRRQQQSGSDARSGRGNSRSTKKPDDNGSGPSDGGRGSGKDASDKDTPNKSASDKDTSDNDAADKTGGGSGDGDEGEGGNKRRRRRGRNRESTEEYTGDPIAVSGILDVQREGFGFLRTNGHLQSRDDVYVSVKQVRQFGLRPGDEVAGGSRPAFRNEKNPALLSVEHVNGGDPEAAKGRPDFDDLTPLFPDEKLVLELPKNPNAVAARIIDLIAPIGKGQRGLIVSPPKAGKTMIMKQIAQAIERNSPDVELMVLLIDERPEEVTDMRRSLESAEVIGSTFDRPTEEHCRIAELVIERAKRRVEEGKDVVVILDGITRLVRAYNMAGNLTGRAMSGGLDTGAIYPPKKFFGAARNVEEGGSLTILATALVETGSRMDEVIFEEFKGTGNMELKLDRRLAERRIYPAIDVDASSTRHEELLFSRKHLDLVWKLRRVLQAMQGDESSGAGGLELLIERMQSFKTNDDFLDEIAKS